MNVDVIKMGSIAYRSRRIHRVCHYYWESGNTHGWWHVRLYSQSTQFPVVARQLSRVTLAAGTREGQGTCEQRLILSIIIIASAEPFRSPSIRYPLSYSCTRIFRVVPFYSLASLRCLRSDVMRWSLPLRALCPCSMLRAPRRLLLILFSRPMSR